MGIRQKVAEEFGSSPNKEGKLGKQHAKDVVVTPERAEDYHLELASSIFCGVMPGDGWSGRMEDSILQGCIPVVIQVLARLVELGNQERSYTLFMQLPEFCLFTCFRMEFTYHMRTFSTMTALLFGFGRMRSQI